MPTASFLHTPVSRLLRNESCEVSPMQIDHDGDFCLCRYSSVSGTGMPGPASSRSSCCSSLSRLTIGSEVLLGFHLRGFTFVSWRVSGLCSGRRRPALQIAGAWAESRVLPIAAGLFGIWGWFWIKFFFGYLFSMLETDAYVMCEAWGTKISNNATDVLLFNSRASNYKMLIRSNV